MYDFKTFTFGTGQHKTREDGMCLVEATAYVAGEEHTDHPVCACPVLSTFLRSWNDSITDDGRRRELLAPFVFRLVGTKSTPEIEQQRSFMCLDWLVRVHTPALLALNPSLVVHAKKLRALALIIDMATVIEAGEAVRAASAAASNAASNATSNAASNAAYDAARAAASNAAYDAARAAARAAAYDATYAATSNAAYAAARDAARAAARAALSETVRSLQDSASDLVDRMIRLTEPQEIVPVKQSRKRVLAK
jgi:hypothetical protein